MIGIWKRVSIDQLFSTYVKKNLLISKSPIAHHEHQYRGKSQNFNSYSAKTLIIHWWFSIPICYKQSFHEVFIDNAYQSYWEHYWNIHSIHKAYVNLNNNRIISIFHQIFWTRIQLNILIEFSTFSVLFVISTSTIKEPY